MNSPTQKNPKEKPVIEPEEIDNGGEVIHQTEIKRSTWAGPLPPPAIIADYDAIVANGAERIFTAFEAEGNHRREMEKKTLNLQGRDLIVGKGLALVFLILAFGLVALAIIKNQPWVAAVISAGALSTIAFGFMRVFGDKGSSEDENTD